MNDDDLFIPTITCVCILVCLVFGMLEYVKTGSIGKFGRAEFSIMIGFLIIVFAYDRLKK